MKSNAWQLKNGKIDFVFFFVGRKSFSLLLIEQLNALPRYACATRQSNLPVYDNCAIYTTDEVDDDDGDVVLNKLIFHLQQEIIETSEMNSGGK